MKKIIIQNIINKMKFYLPDIDDKKIKIISYGLESIYLFLTKFTIILICSFFLKQINFLFLFISLFIPLRFFGFGLHLKSSKNCLIISLIIFLLFPFLIKVVSFNLFFKVLLAFISFLCFLFFAPADTEKRPLINKKKRIILKLSGLILIIFYFIFSLKTNNNLIVSTIYLAMILECLLINPISYKLFNVNYRNYKRKE